MKRKIKKAKAFVAGLSSESATMLIIPVAIRPQGAPTQKEIWVNALIDTGSNATIISRRAKDMMKAQGYKDSLDISGINLTQSDGNAWFVEPIEVRSLQNGRSMTAREVVSLDKSGLDDVEVHDFSDIAKRMGIPLRQPVKDNKDELRVDILLGLDMDKYWMFHKYRKYKRYRAVASDMGWSISRMPNYDSTPFPSNAPTRRTFRVSAKAKKKLPFTDCPPLTDDSEDETDTIKKTFAVPPLNKKDREGIEQTQKALIERIHQDLQRHMAVDDIKDDDGYTVEEQRCLDLLEKSYTVKDGRAYVSPLWKEGQPEPGLNTYAIAKSRLLSVYRKLDKRSWQSLNTIFEEYKKADIVERVDISATDRYETDGIYWPMFPVTRESETTPVRPVMDGAAKILQGKSINQKCFSPGPCLINDLTKVLARFRRYNVGFMGDISKMFLKVLVPEEYRKYYRFLWISEDGKEIYVYQFKGHLFGNNGSPTVAIFATQRNARDFIAKYPLAVDVILHDTIVDDHLSSAPTAEEVIEIYRQLQEIHGNIGLKLAKCATNSPEVSAQLPEGLTKSEKMVSFDAYVSETARAPNTENSMPHVLTLGQKWNMVNDTFTYAKVEPDKNAVWTKASCLSQAHKIFDPLCFIAPLLLSSKLYIQSLWAREKDWKDPLTEEDDLNDWLNWLEILPNLHELSFNRCLLPGLPDEFDTIQIHIFSDASKVAIAASAYIRLTYNNGKKPYVNFIQAKCRIVPQKLKRTIPKLELASIELASWLALHVAKPLDIPLSSITLWSDSKTALQWLRMDQNHLQVFCHNYCKKTKARFDDAYVQNKTIRWVSGDQNPADISTREIGFKEFKSRLPLWRDGPAFLREDETSWPTLPALEQTSEVLQEVKKEYKLWRKDINCFLLFGQSDSGLINLNRFGSYTKLVRSFAYVLRLRDMAKKYDTDRTIPINKWEFERAELYLVSLHQKQYFDQELADLRNGELPVRHVLRRLGAELSLETLRHDVEVEVLRLSGRTRFATHLDRKMRCPLLIKPGTHFTDLLLRHYHEKVLNHAGGLSCLLCEINRSFWVVGNVSSLKKIIRTCAECRKANPTPKLNIMAPLPDSRVPGSTDTMLPPFTATAMDVAGPWYTTQGRGKARQKRWILIFRCAMIGAIHLEVLYDMTEEACLRALSRFTSRQLKPKIIYSDLGTNFQGSRNTIEQLWGSIGLQSGVEFRFSPADAPHYNGLVERVVQMTKKALKPILKDAILNDEDFITYVTKVEGLLNQRPLAWRHLPDSNDPEPLTPAHFQLRGNIGEELTPIALPKNQGSLSARLKTLHDLVNQFYRRFTTMILPTLRSYSKWASGEHDLQVGDIVVILTDDLPVQKRYPLGRISACLPGRDGIARRFEIQLPGKEHRITRSNNRLIRLPTDDFDPTLDNRSDSYRRVNTKTRSKAKKQRDNARKSVFFAMKY